MKRIRSPTWIKPCIDKNKQITNKQITIMISEVYLLWKTIA